MAVVVVPKVEAFVSTSSLSSSSRDMHWDFLDLPSSMGSTSEEGVPVVCLEHMTFMASDFDVLGGHAYAFSSSVFGPLLSSD